MSGGRNNRNTEEGSGQSPSYLRVALREPIRNEPREPEPEKYIPTRYTIPTPGGIKRLFKFNHPQSNEDFQPTNTSIFKYPTHYQRDVEYTHRLFWEWRDKYGSDLRILYLKFLEILKSYKVICEEEITEEKFLIFAFNNSLVKNDRI